MLQGGVGRAVHERELELATDELLDELLVVGGLGETHLDARPPVDVAAPHLGEKPDAGALEGADTKRAGLALGQGDEVGLCRAHRRDGTAGVA